MLSDLEWKLLEEACRRVRVSVRSLNGSLEVSEEDFLSALLRLSSGGFIKLVSGWVSPTLSGRMVIELSNISGRRRWIVVFTGGRRGLASLLKSKGFARFKAGVWFAPYSKETYGDIASTRGVEVAVCRCQFMEDVWRRSMAHREVERLIARAKRMVERAENFLAGRSDEKVGFDVWDICSDVVSILRRALKAAGDVGVSVGDLAGSVEAAEGFVRAGVRGDREHAYECLVRVGWVVEEFKRRLSLKEG